MSRESSYSEGDLRNTGMALKHERTWDYELDRIVDALDLHHGLVARISRLVSHFSEKGRPG